MVKFCPELRQAATIRGTMTVTVETTVMSIGGVVIEAAVDDTTIGIWEEAASPTVQGGVADEAASSNAVDEEEGIIGAEAEAVEEIEGEAGMIVTRITGLETLNDSMMENLT